METAMIIFAMLGAVVFGVLQSWQMVVQFRAERKVARAKQLLVDEITARVRENYELAASVKPLTASQP